MVESVLAAITVHSNIFKTIKNTLWLKYLAYFMFDISDNEQVFCVLEQSVSLTLLHITA